MKDLPVDTGMIGIVPVAAINRGAGCWKDGGAIVKIRGGCYLSLQYEDGLIMITAGPDGEVPVPEDTDFWVGDLCYVLDSNIPLDREWSTAAEPEPGYWAACLRSFETPFYGSWYCRAVPLPNGMAGLVSRTKWGDGKYSAYANMDGIYTTRIEVNTGDEFDEDEEE